MGRFRRRGPILNEEEDESVLLPRRERRRAMQRWADQESAMWEGAPDRPTSACYTVARRGEATRRRGRRRRAMEWIGWLCRRRTWASCNGRLVSYKKRKEKMISFYRGFASGTPCVGCNESANFTSLPQNKRLCEMSLQCCEFYKCLLRRSRVEAEIRNWFTLLTKSE